MDAIEMAQAIAYALNKDCWTAEGDYLAVVNFTNEDGEKFILTVEAVDSFPSES